MPEHLYPYLQLEAKITEILGGSPNPREIRWMWTTVTLSVTNLGHRSTSLCLLGIYTSDLSGDLSWDDYALESYVVLFLQPGEKVDIPLSSFPGEGESLIDLARRANAPTQSIAAVYDMVYDPLPAVVVPQDRKIEAIPREAFMGKRPAAIPLVRIPRP